MTIKISRLFPFLLIFVVLLTDSTHPQFLPWRNMGISHADNLAVSSVGNIYVSANGVLYKSENEGELWTIIGYLNVEKIKTLGTDSLFIGTSEGNLIFSPDGGTTYDPIYSFASKVFAIEFIDLEDSTVIAIGTANGYVHISSDFGTTWNSQQISTGYINSIKYISSRIYAATSKGLFYSDDFGQTWHNMIVVVIDEPVFDIETDSMNNLYVSANYDIYKSTDSGNTWTFSFDRLVFVIQYSPEGEIFAGNYRSLDQGQTWHKVIPTDVYDISFKDSVTFVVADNAILYTDRYIYREELNPYTGTNFFPLSVGNIWQYKKDEESYNGGFTYTNNYSLINISVILDTIIAGEEYFKVGNIDTAQYFRYGEDNKLYVWQNSTEYVYMDFNLIWGETFSYFGNSSMILDGYGTIFGSERFFKGHKFGTLDNGTTRWYIDSVGLNNDFYFWGGGMGSYFRRKLELIDASVFINDSLYYYSNYVQPQVLFSPINAVDTLVINLTFNVNHAHSKFSTNGESRNFIKDVWIEYFYAKEDSSTNKDSILCQISETSTNCSAEIILDSMKFADGFKFYYAIYARDKALIPQTSRSPEVDYYELVYDPNPNSVSGEKDNLYSFDLQQNYPNPFNPVTKIKYTIPQTVNPLPGGARGGFTTLRVYDILGREIATLVNEQKPAGEYEVEFNAANLPSGIYFYQLNAGVYRETRKMVLIK